MSGSNASHDSCPHSLLPLSPFSSPSVEHRRCASSADVGRWSVLLTAWRGAIAMLHGGRGKGRQGQRRMWPRIVGAIAAAHRAQSVSAGGAVSNSSCTSVAAAASTDPVWTQSHVQLRRQRHVDPLQRLVEQGKQHRLLVFRRRTRGRCHWRRRTDGLHACRRREHWYR